MSNYDNNIILIYNNIDDALYPMFNIFKGKYIFDNGSTYI